MLSLSLVTLECRTCGHQCPLSSLVNPNWTKMSRHVREGRRWVGETWGVGGIGALHVGAQGAGETCVEDAGTQGVGETCAQGAGETWIFPLHAVTEETPAEETCPLYAATGESLAEETSYGVKTLRMRCWRSVARVAGPGQESPYPRPRPNSAAPRTSDEA